MVIIGCVRTFWGSGKVFEFGTRVCLSDTGLKSLCWGLSGEYAQHRLFYGGAGSTEHGL